MSVSGPLAAKCLAERVAVLTSADAAPDHGKSPWSDRFDYFVAADQVAQLLSADDPAALAHSWAAALG